MALGISTAERSKHGRVSVRSHRSKASSQPGSSKMAAEEGEAKKPDIDELRQRRAAYFARPVADRQKVIRPKTSHVTSATSKASRSSDSERRRKKRSHLSSKDSRHKIPASKDSRAEAPSADYVYGQPPVIQRIVEEQVPVDTPPSTHESTDGRSERRHRSRHSVSHRHGSSEKLDVELTPDDSISVVAERRSTSSRSRPSLKRSSTTKIKLPPIDESPSTPSLTSTRKTSKRDSTLLGSLLRRQSTSAVPTAPRLIECLTCGSDDVPRASSAKLACGHRMCHECLKRVFDMSVKDPAHMPPRCCTDEHIPLKYVDKLFDLKFKVLWNRKYQEYNTKNRIYCPAPKCGEWIKPSDIHRDAQGRKYAHCQRCKTKVCTLCNNKMHRSKDCPEDPEIAKLVSQAKEQGWQRCYNCSSMVELKEGCNHMTYRLMEMRVPEPIQVLYRRVFNAANLEQPAPPLVEGPPPERTYREEMEHRRTQERLDADLARRLQLASLMETEDQPRRAPHTEMWGLGNAAGHFLNDDFVQNAANVVMSAFGDANMGRRGDRVSGRRRRPRMPEQDATQTGLVPNFLGDESVLGVPARRPGRAPA
ncbi:hypothetical protein LTR17_019077 [Elasticomyces elasticus]|nr:hypothetical protein LTR17_019077 [Elasticomyces elasticus]